MCNSELEPIKSTMDNMVGERAEKLEQTLAVIGCILSELVGTMPVSEKILSESLTMSTRIPKERIQEIFAESKRAYKES